METPGSQPLMLAQPAGLNRETSGKESLGLKGFPVAQLVKFRGRNLRSFRPAKFVEALLHETVSVTPGLQKTLLRQMKASQNMLAEQMITEHGRNFTVPPSTNIDTARVKAGYEDVRSDCTETQWAVFKYSDASITLSAKGKEFEAFKQQFEDNERCYGYIRFQTGDEMSKRTKFVLVTWIGKDVGVMPRAKVTSDKSLVKQVISNYAVEFQLENNVELDEHYFKEELTKIGGTKYGTGVINES